MKLTIIFLPLAFLAILFSSCDSPKNESKINIEQETKAGLMDDDFKSTLKEINQVMDKAILDGDYETLLKYYTDDVIVMPIFEPAIRGKKELREAYKKNKKAGVKYHAFNGNPEEMWSCGKEVFEYGKFGLALSTRETEYPSAYYGSYFML
ncbi:MAG: hypothetical protein JSW63_12730 [Ignavibacterium sp.]|nr:MAG: hypothetical protein JSW63_12730 [Ignavibacterium sp.]